MRDWRIVVGIAAATGVAIGLGLGLMLGGDAREDSSVGTGGTAPANSNAPATEDPEWVAQSNDPEWVALREMLARERKARLVLADEIDLLWEELEFIAQGAEPASPITEPPNPDDTAGKPTDVKLRFDGARLARAGLPLDEIERLRERYEATELDELYLRDQAAREGWLHGSRFRRESRSLEGQLREDLGEEDYDRMLFATSQKNRVRVKDVLQHSPAADAGLRAGDLILRYANKRIFNTRSLRTSTTQGIPGKTVWIEILRNGEIIPVGIPRGPLGVQIEGESLPPE